MSRSIEVGLEDVFGNGGLGCVSGTENIDGVGTEHSVS